MLKKIIILFMSLIASVSPITEKKNSNRRFAPITTTTVVNTINLTNVSLASVQNSNYIQNFSIYNVARNKITFTFDYLPTASMNNLESFSFYVNLNLFNTNSEVVLDGFINSYYATDMSSDYSFYQIVKSENSDYFSGTVYTYNDSSNFTYLDNVSLNRVQYQFNFRYDTRYSEANQVNYLTIYFAYYDNSSVGITEDQLEQAYQNGLTDGYNLGFTDGQVNANPFGGFFDILKSATDSMHNIFSIEILPNLTLSTILGIFVAIPLFIFFLKLISAK